ncbi:MAG TPA: PrsW family glutamic-type intramembrane protease, partial [Sphingomicrobium sp.]|nr:PrsW family glutamic-type intramembrane protease [Sphingomicrobium sp.]
WSVALIPVLLMVLLFAWLDVFKLMVPGELIGPLVMGGIMAFVAWPVSGEMLDALPLGYSFYSRIIAPWIEEALKMVPIVLLIYANRIGYKIDAIIIGFGIGAGFSVVENIFYLVRYPELSTPIWLVRGLGTAVMHGTTTAVLATVAHELGERGVRSTGEHKGINPLLFLPGYLVATIIHLTFNQFPDRPGLVMLVTMLVAPLVLLGLLRFGEGETKQWLVEESENHRRWLEEWRGGGFPADPSGQRIAELTRRAGKAEAARIREYCILKTELVLAAEIELMDGDRDVDEGERQRLRDGFDRLAQLQQEIGRTVFAALRRILPFSRNDEWELAELQEIIGKSPGN